MNMGRQKYHQFETVQMKSHSQPTSRQGHNRPDHLHFNVDSLSCHSMSNLITLLHVGNEWQRKLWNSYLSDQSFWKILQKLAKLKPPEDKEAQVDREKTEMNASSSDKKVQGMTDEGAQEMNVLNKVKEEPCKDKDAAAYRQTLRKKSCLGIKELK